MPNFLAHYGCEEQSRDKPEFLVHQICTIHVLHGDFECMIFSGCKFDLLKLVVLKLHAIACIGNAGWNCWETGLLWRLLKMPPWWHGDFLGKHSVSPGLSQVPTQRYYQCRSITCGLWCWLEAMAIPNWLSLSLQVLLILLGWPKSRKDTHPGIGLGSIRHLNAPPKQNKTTQALNFACESQSWQASQRNSTFSGTIPRIMPTNQQTKNMQLAWRLGMVSNSGSKRIQRLC